MMPPLGLGFEEQFRGIGKGAFIPSGPWSRVQGIDAQSTASNSISFSSSVSHGSIVVGACLLTDPISVINVTDDKGNGYDVTTFGDLTGGETVFGFMSRGLITNAPTTITITPNTAPPTFFFKVIEEWTPPTGTVAISLDGQFGGTIPNGGLTGLADTKAPPFTTLNNDVLLFSAVWDQNGTPTAGAGWNGPVIADAANILWTFNKTATISNANNQFSIGASTTGEWVSCFGIAPVARTSWKPVQWAMVPVTGTAVNTISCSFPNNVTPGNIVVGGFGAMGATITSIVDNLGGTYTSDILIRGSDSSHGIFWSGGVLASAPKTFTINSSVAQISVMTLAEFALPSGTSTVAIDGSPVANSYSGAGVTTISVPLTTTHNGDLIYTWLQAQGGWAANGFNQLNNFGVKNSDAYLIQPTAGSISLNWNMASTTATFLFGVALHAS